MTSQAESTYPQDWFRIAAADLGRVKRRLAEGDVEDAAFHLQQAIEKGLKVLCRKVSRQRVLPLRDPTAVLAAPHYRRRRLRAAWGPPLRVTRCQPGHQPGFRQSRLKGYLLSHGWTLRRIHDVDALLTDAIRYDAGLARYRSLCQQVAGYYIIERYPVFGDEPLIGDVRTAYQEAKALMQRLQSSRRPQRGLRGG